MATKLTPMERRTVKLRFADAAPNTFDVPVLGLDDITIPAHLQYLRPVILGATGTTAAFFTKLTPELSGPWQMTLTGLHVFDPVNSTDTDVSMVKIVQAIGPADLYSALPGGTSTLGAGNSTSPLVVTTNGAMLDMSFIFTDYDGETASDATLTMGAVDIETYEYVTTETGLKFGSIVFNGYETPVWS